MPLRGKGMLAVFTEVKSRHEADLNDWYDREHLDERVSVPGFHRARRYAAMSAVDRPKFLATYECDRVGNLATPAYLAKLARPTPWSRRVTVRFTRFHRLTLRVRVDLAHGIGGFVTAVRFTPDPRAHRALAAWLDEKALARAVARPGVVGAIAAENDPDTANTPLNGDSRDRVRATEAEWLVLLEGTDPKATAAVAHVAFGISALRRFGVAAAPTIGTYRLLCGVEAPARRRR
jgi:hypothetical protein